MANECYNCDALAVHEAFGDICAPPRPGGIDSAVLVLCGEELADPTSGTEVDALITAEGAKLVKQIAMSLEGSEQILSQYLVTPCDTPRVQYVNWTGTMRDLMFSTTNFEFWTQLINGYKVSAILAHLCLADGWDDVSLYMKGNISFAGNPIIPLDGTDTDRFEVTYTFRGEISLIATPAGVFD